MKILIIHSNRKIGRKTIDRVLSGHLLDDVPDDIHLIKNNTIKILKDIWQFRHHRCLAYRGKFYKYDDLPIYKYKVNETGDLVLDYSLTAKERFFVVDQNGKPVRWVFAPYKEIMSFDEFLIERLNSPIIEVSDLKKMESVPENYIAKTSKGAYRVYGKLFYSKYMLDWDYMTVDEVLEHSAGKDTPRERVVPNLPRFGGLFGLFNRDDDDDDGNRPTELTLKFPPKLAINIDQRLLYKCGKQVFLDANRAMASALGFKSLKAADKALKASHSDFVEFRATKDKNVDNANPSNILKYPDEYPKFNMWPKLLTEHGMDHIFFKSIQINPFITSDVNKNLTNLIYDSYIFLNYHLGQLTNLTDSTPPISGDIVSRVERQINRHDNGRGFYTFIKYT